MIRCAVIFVLAAGLWVAPAQAAVFGAPTPLAKGQPIPVGLVGGAPGTAALVTVGERGGPIVRVTAAAVRGGVAQVPRTMATRGLFDTVRDDQGRLLLLVQTGAVGPNGRAAAAVVRVDATGAMRALWRGSAPPTATVGAGPAGRLAVAWMQRRSLIVVRVAPSGREVARVTARVLPRAVDPRRTEVRGLAIAPGPGQELDAVVSIAGLADDRLDRTAPYTWGADGRVRRGPVLAGATRAAGWMRLVRAPDGRVAAMLRVSGVSPADGECVSEEGHLARGAWLAMRPAGALRFGRLVNVQAWTFNCVAEDDLVVAPDGRIAAAWGYAETASPFVRVAQAPPGAAFGPVSTVPTRTAMFAAAFGGAGPLTLLTSAVFDGATMQPAALWRDGLRDDLGLDIGAGDLVTDAAGRLIAAGARDDGRWVVAFER